MRLRNLLSLVFAASAVAGVAALACGGAGFDSQSNVNSVRIFGVRADKPYANAGDQVTLEVLATDGRLDKTRPLKIYWIPVVCINPQDDLYYACFAGARLEPPVPTDGGVTIGGAGLDAGAGALLASIPMGIDLGAFVPQGPTFHFQMPANVLQPREGSPPYGLAIVFNVACAGQVRLAPRSGANPQQVPILCTDEEGNALGPEDFVIGINRVYSYGDRVNTNPVVEDVTLDGGAVDLAAGITMGHCTADRRRNCDPIKIDVRVSDSSWELAPSFGESQAQHEQIWVTYYSDIGTLQDDARLLFDPKTGRVDKSGVDFRAPDQPADGTLWAVVHDNRAGAAFVVLPLHVK